MVIIEIIMSLRRSLQSMQILLVNMDDCKEWNVNGDCGDDHVDYGDHRRACRR